MVDVEVEVVVVVVVVVEEGEGEGECDMYLEETCLPFGLLGIVPLLLLLSFSEEVNGSSEMAATISESLEPSLTLPL